MVIVCISKIKTQKIVEGEKFFGFFFSFKALLKAIALKIKNEAIQVFNSSLFISLQTKLIWALRKSFRSKKYLNVTQTTQMHEFSMLR